MKQLYFDSDDDITAIINKLEEIESSRVALIPPKRSTILQSVVNLKLLRKAAGANENEMVLITKDPVILNVASQLKILTAPNLETEPSVPSPKESTREVPSAVIDGSQASDKDYKSADKALATESEEKPKKDKKSLSDKKNKKVPDFNRFKKYLLIGLAALLLIGGGLWWALFVAPFADINIDGRTQDVSVNSTFHMDPGAETSDIENNTLAADLRQESRTLSTTFNPTGTKIVGDRATGEVTITNCESDEEITLEAGTAITAANGRVFRNNVSATIPGSGPTTGFAGCDESGQNTLSVTADDIGEEYNIGPTSYTVEGYSSDNVYGDGGNMTGGEKEEVTVVSAEDVANAKNKLLKEERANVKKTLSKQFDEEQFIIEESFYESVEQTTSEPAVGAQSNEARLVLQVTYTLLATQQEDMEELLTKLYKAEAQSEDTGDVDNPEELESLGVIDYGLEDLNIQKTGNNTTFNLAAKGVLGPDLQEKELKQELADKSYAEAIEILESKPNVSKVEVHLSPFWVSKVPDNPDKIEIFFDVTEQSTDDDDTGD